MGDNGIIKSISIGGFRGYNKQHVINLAKPDGKEAGSGLTILVGPNNSGKTSVIEAIYLMTSNIDIIPNEYNNICNDKLNIEVDFGNHIYSFSTDFSGSSRPVRSIDGEKQGIY